MTNPQKVSANAANAGLSADSFGYLVWWTIHQKVYDLGDLRHTARANQLPQAFVDKLIGADPNIAFSRATSLGAGGQIASQSTADLRYRFVTRAVHDNTRILALETVDASNVKLDVTQLGNLTLDGFMLTFTTINRPNSPGLQKELDQLIQKMGADLANRIGRIDDTKLRQIILSWCADMNRVSMRNSGGIYFLPSGAKRDALTDQILGLSQWFLDNEIGRFSSVELFPTPTTSTDDIIQSALDEIDAELTEVSQKLTDYSNSTGMNAGSRMYSAGTQLDRLKALTEKGRALKDSLGDPIALALSKIELLTHRARTMQNDSAAIVQRERDSKDLTVAKVDVQGAKINPNGSKTGTARQRREKITI